jgi:hypothetical protein
MARYRIRYWKDFPSVVSAEGDGISAKAMLSDRFQEAIDQASMVEGSTDTDAYLAGWMWGPVEERPGSAQEVVDAVVGEIEAEYTPERLMSMVRSSRPGQG